MALTRVADELRRRGGVGTWAAVSAATSSSAVGRAVASASVTLALPGVLVLTDRLGDPVTRLEACLLYAGEGSQLSHLSALQRHGLPVPEHEADAVHVLVPHRRRRRSQRQFPVHVVVHRSRTGSRPALRHGFPTSTPEQAVVESWPLLRGPAQRAPALVAIRRRLLSVERLSAEVDRHRQLVQRPDLARLVGRLEAGCRSELELWGHERVFTGPRFEDLERQVLVTVSGRTFHLDGYDARAALAIELDGRQYHDSPRDRERDAARDALLAEVGIQTVRFPHSRLTGDAAGCRESAWRTVQVRRTQLLGTALPQVVPLSAPVGADGPRVRLELPRRS